MEIVNRWLFIIPLDKFLCQTRANEKNRTPLSIPIQFVWRIKEDEIHSLFEFIIIISSTDKNKT